MLPLGCVRTPGILVRPYSFSCPLVEPKSLVEEEAWGYDALEPLELPKSIQSWSFGSPTVDNS